MPQSESRVMKILRNEITFYVTIATLTMAYAGQYYGEQMQFQNLSNKIDQQMVLDTERRSSMKVVADAMSESIKTLQKDVKDIISRVVTLETKNS